MYSVVAAHFSPALAATWAALDAVIAVVPLIPDASGRPQAMRVQMHEEQERNNLARALSERGIPVLLEDGPPDDRLEAVFDTAPPEVVDQWIRPLAASTEIGWPPCTVPLASRHSRVR